MGLGLVLRVRVSGSGFGLGPRRPRAPPSGGARPPISRQAQRPLEHARHGSPPPSPATCALGPDRIVLGGAPHCSEGLAAMPPRARAQRPGHGRLSLAPTPRMQRRSPRRSNGGETISGFLQWYLRDMVAAYAAGKWRPERP